MRVTITLSKRSHTMQSLPPLQVITPDMKEFILRLKEKAVIGIVGGSDLPKMEEQMGGDGGEEKGRGLCGGGSNI